MRKFILLWLFVFSFSPQALAQNHAIWDHLLPMNAAQIVVDPSRPDSIWIAGDGGVKRYQAQGDSWVAYTTADGLSKMFSFSLKINQNHVWIGFPDGYINLFDMSENRVIKSTRLMSSHSERGLSIVAIDIDEDWLWAGTDEGLFQLGKSTLEIIDRFTQDDGLTWNYASALFITQDDVWVTTRFSGATIGNSPDNTGSISRITKKTKKIQTFIVSGYPNAIVNAEHVLWITTEQELIAFDTNNGNFTVIAADELNLAHSLVADSNSIWCVGVSTIHDPFVSTPFLFQIDKQTQTILNTYQLPEDLRHAEVSQNGPHLFLAKAEVLYKFTKSTETFEPISHPFIKLRTCLSIASDDDRTYLSCANTLHVIENSTLSLTSVEIHPNRQELIREVQLDGKDLWISTQNGLFLYDAIRLQRLAAYFPNILVFSVYLDQEYIWASTQYGLQRLNKNNNRIQSLNVLGNDMIWDIAFGTTSLWASFSGKDDNGMFTGIAKIDRKTLTATHVHKTPITDATNAIESLIDAGAYLLGSGQTMSIISKEDLSFTPFADYKASIMRLQKSRLWAQVEGGGIKVFDIHSKTELAHINESMGLLFDGIWAMDIGNKYGWFVTSRGISRLTLSSVFSNRAAHPDFDNNGTVDFSDFLLFAPRFGSTINDGIYDDLFDLNKDDHIDLGDFLLFAKAYEG